MAFLVHRRYDPNFAAREHEKKKNPSWKETRCRLLVEQDFKCAICSHNISEYPQLDHDHENGKIRGVLCTTCNSGLGMFKDSCYLLDKAIEYLTLHMKIPRS